MSRRTTAIAVFALLLTLAAADSSDVLAQDRSTVDQISPGSSERAADLEPSQIGTNSADISMHQQLGSQNQRPIANQLTGESGSALPLRQLYTGGPTAQPAEALSRPSEGRKEAGVVQRVVGSDRCDTGATGRKDKRCSQVIETRSAEFEKPHPTELTPEQRLLISQQQAEGTTNARSLARRLGSGDDPQSIEEQGIAATVAPRNAPPAVGVEKKHDAAIDPAVQAFVDALVANAQR